MIRSALLAAVRGVGHAHSTREDGAVGDVRLPGAAGARAELTRAAGADPAALVVPEQVHGARVAIASQRGATFPATDGLATEVRGIPLLVQGADCPLLALADGGAGVAAVAHSGWRGTAARIAGEAVRVAESLGASRTRIVAAVFPGIGPCCFEVGPEVSDVLRESFGPAATRWFASRAAGDRLHLDLRAAIVATLVEAGIDAGRVDVVPGCTACDGTLFSHRASRGGPERHGLCVTLL